jgi:small-conductance mechanosensitive channel
LVGYLVATRGWVSSAFWATWLVVAIVQFSLRHGPGAAARQAVEKRRKDAEREYDQRETWGSWPT